MSDDPNTAADLFADDIMRIVQSRLQVRLVPIAYGQVQVQLVDANTGYAFVSNGPMLGLTLDTVKKDGVVKDVILNMREGY